MATQTTQIAYPVLDSQATATLINDNVAAGDRTGDLSTDLKKALISLLGLSGSNYSLDDLWKRYQLSSNVTSDVDVEGPPARTPPGHGGQHPAHFLPPGRLNNPGNANGFPAGGGGGTDPLFANVWLLANWESVDGNGDYVDLSSNGLVLPDSLQLTRQQAPDPVKYGTYSLNFSGSGTSYIPVTGTGSAGPDTFSIGTEEDFTMEAWIYLDALPSVQADEQCLIGQYRNTGSQRGFLWDIRISDLMFFYFSSNGLTEKFSLTADAGTEFTNTSTWYHVAVERYNNDFYMYKDGVSIATGAGRNDGTAFFIPTEELVIGSIYANGYVNQFTGNMGDVRITKGVARYSGTGFTPPTDAFPTS